MYLDANIIIYATIDTTSLGENCRRILKAINELYIHCSISYLLINEVLYILKKHIGKKDTITIIEETLKQPIK